MKIFEAIEKAKQGLPLVTGRSYHTPLPEELEQGAAVGWIVSGPETVQGHVMHKYAFFGRYRRLR